MKPIRQTVGVLAAVALTIATVAPARADTTVDGSGTQFSNPDSQPGAVTSLTVREFYNRGIQRSSRGDFKGAIQEFDQAIAQNPGFVLAYIARGDAYQSLGNLRTARANFDRAIALNRNYSLAYYRRAYSRYLTGDRKGAIADLNQAIRINLNWGSADLAEALVVRGGLRLELNNRRAALADFDRAVSLKPDSSLIYASRGLALLRMKSPRSALTNLNRAIQLNNQWGFLDLASAYTNRGLLRRDLGDRQGAIADLRRAADLYQKQNNQGGYLALMSQIQKLEDVRPEVPVNLGCYGVLLDQRVQDFGSICAPKPGTVSSR